VVTTPSTLSLRFSSASRIFGPAGVLQPGKALNAITINAGANDAATLRGLNIDGLDVADTGIQINSAASVTIANCVIERFNFYNGSAITAQPASGTLKLSIIDTVLSENAHDGIFVEPLGAANVNGLIKRVTANNNRGNGVSLYAVATTGKVDFAVVDSAAFGNGNAGFYQAACASRAAR